MRFFSAIPFRYDEHKKDLDAKPLSIGYNKNVINLIYGGSHP